MKETEIQNNESTLVASSENNTNGFLNIFISTFLSVFLAELGDKTQIATLLLSAQSGKPLLVFAGAALALICSTLFVVVLGRFLSKNISQIRIRFISSFIMLVIGIWFGAQAIEAFINHS
tara:strand:+ start:6475 stop:6834 length:360 start_codon:yes stop_codon:yes gene_type:complete